MEKSRRKNMSSLSKGESMKFSQGFTLHPKNPVQKAPPGTENEETGKTPVSTYKTIDRKQETIVQDTMTTEQEEETSSARTYNKLIPDTASLPLDKKPEDLDVMELLKVVIYYDECIDTLNRIYMRVAPLPFVLACVLLMFAPLWVTASVGGLFLAITAVYVGIGFKLKKKRYSYDNYRDTLLTQESQKLLFHMRDRREERRVK